MKRQPLNYWGLPVYMLPCLTFVSAVIYVAWSSWWI
jgi:hypothetical protein